MKLGCQHKGHKVLNLSKGDTKILISSAKCVVCMCIVYGTCFLARGDSNGEHTTGVVPVPGPAVAAVGRNWVMSGTGVTHTPQPHP